MPLTPTTTPTDPAKTTPKSQYGYWHIWLPTAKQGRGPAVKSDPWTASQHLWGTHYTDAMAINLGTRIGPVQRQGLWRDLATAIKAVDSAPGLYRFDHATKTLERVGSWVGKYNLAFGMTWEPTA